MTVLNSLQTAVKALFQVNTTLLVDLVSYRVGLLSGVYELRSRKALKCLQRLHLTQSSFKPVRIPTPSQINSFKGNAVIQQADLICMGKYACFGADPTPLDLSPHVALASWCEFEKGKIRPDIEDIKFIWEPSRFGWAITLARAFAYSGNVKYLQTFLKLTNEFWRLNPPYQGPNWTSAQETAIRLISLSWACSIFWNSSNLNEISRNDLANILAVHATRLPLTLAYAKAQNNNHLLFEAAGMITAGSIFPGFRRFALDQKSGWEIFHKALNAQIDKDGNYIQQSNTYQRLMLQVALWVWNLTEQIGNTFPPGTIAKLQKATCWLAGQVEKTNGRVPNLGANDGANLLPLSDADILDYRPTLQAAGCAFLGTRLLDKGNWDEMAAWLGISPSKFITRTGRTSSGAVRLESKRSHAFLRAVTFLGRPGHSDQLHVDLWADGVNIAQDPGTYLYNARSPWENALAGANVHNTVTVDGKDPMTRAGKFLWLDRSQARIVERNDRSCTTESDGYRQLGISHRRTLAVTGTDHWLITDEIRSTTDSRTEHMYTVHWLLPDWKWRLKDNSFEFWLEKQNLWVTLRINCTAAVRSQTIQVIKAGKSLLDDERIEPILGWYSPTYSVKVPALAVRFIVQSAPPVMIQSEFTITRRRLVA